MATVTGTQTSESILDKGVVLKGTALLTPGDATLSIPIPTNHQALVGRELEIIWEVDLEEESGAGVLPPVTDPPAHAPTHIRGGTDEIDGDQLDIDFLPTNYTPDTSPAEVTSTEHLTAHLKGIDDIIGTGGGVIASGVSVVTTAFDGALSAADTNVQLALETLDNAPAVPTSANKNMAASTTTTDNDQATGTAVAFTPAFDGHVEATVNGVPCRLGDGVKAGVECYFSGDSGATARLIRDIVAGDTMRWNGSVAGFQLAGIDRISFNYNVNI
ncbi:hypothetical protein LCGC14_0758810 [marine sediment metagenome]|uniref:Uncharacterized protein n=1 Tax=marine sediment metagenome TaxID=412755 RepID=A0A0F9SLY6_9ZZZZ